MEVYTNKSYKDNDNFHNNYNSKRIEELRNKAKYTYEKVYQKYGFNQAKIPKITELLFDFDIHCNS